MVGEDRAFSAPGIRAEGDPAARDRPRAAGAHVDQPRGRLAVAAGFSMSGPRPSPEGRGGGPPTVSVIVPVLNEEKYIETCLRQLLVQEYPVGRLEILVIDCRSDDRTREIVGGFQRSGGRREGGGAGAGGRGDSPPVRLLKDPQRQRASALNVGVRAAAGDVIVRIDARTVVQRDYIRRCVATLQATGADNVGGIQQPIAA